MRSAPVALRLPYRPPLAVDPLVRALRAHAVPGLERGDPDGALTRVIRAPGGPAVVRVTIGRGDGEMRAELRPRHPGDVAHLLLAVRRWLGLDVDPGVVDAALAFRLHADEGVRQVRLPAGAEPAHDHQITPDFGARGEEFLGLACYRIGEFHRRIDRCLCAHDKRTLVLYRHEFFIDETERAERQYKKHQRTADDLPRIL